MCGFATQQHRPALSFFFPRFFVILANGGTRAISYEQFKRVIRRTRTPGVVMSLRQKPAAFAAQIMAAFFASKFLMILPGTDDTVPIVKRTPATRIEHGRRDLLFAPCPYATGFCLFRGPLEI